MKKKVLMGAAKKAQIALAVMAVCGMSFVGTGKAFAEVSDEDFAALQAKVTALETAKNNSVVSYGKVEAATGVNSVTIGNGANNPGANSIVIGNTAFTTGPSSVTLNKDGGYSVTLLTNNGSKGPTINLDTTDLVGGASGVAMDQTTFNNYLANSNMGDLLQNSFDAKADKTDLDGKANVGGDNITTGDGSKWTEKLGTGAIASGDTNLVNGDTVYNELRPEDGNYVAKDNTTAANLSALDGAIGAYSDDAAKNIDKNVSVKANISALDNEIGSDDDITSSNVITAGSSVKSNLSALDKYMGDIKKIGTDDDYSIIDRNGDKVQGDTLNVADILNVIDDKVGDLNKENKYVVEDEDGNLVEIGSYNHIDGKTSLAENMENIDAAIGSTADGAYVSSKASVGENLNALDNQVLANTNAINRLDNKVNKVGAGAAAGL